MPYDTYNNTDEFNSVLSVIQALQAKYKPVYMICRCLSKRNPNSFSDMHEGDGPVLNNNHYQDHKHSTSGRSTLSNGTHRADTHIKLVHWNAEGAIINTSAIRTVTR